MLCGKKGDGIIFDTNGLHRGYHPLIGEERLTLQFEFSSTFKGKFVRGQVGPRKDYRSLLGQG